MQTTLERALEIAREAHADQVDKAGRPVIEHVLRVVDAVKGDDVKVVAALHDVLEDGPGWTTDDLRHRGISHFHTIDVFVLTRMRGDTYDGYIRNVSSFATPRVVKIADILDHLHPDRVGAITPSHAARYRAALHRLQAGPEPERGGGHGG